MANIFYPKGKEAFATKLVDWVGDDIRGIIVDSADYTYSAAHDNLDDVPVAARVSTSALASKTATNGELVAANTTFSAVTGDPSEAIILYQHTGVESTSRLLIYIDSATNLPFTPQGNDVVVNWPTPIASL